MEKRWMLSNRGYFFIVDSILALGVLVIGFFLALSAYSKVPSKESTQILSEDLMDFFANTKISDTNNQYGGIGGELWTAGNITHADNTLLQQVGEFYAKGEAQMAGKFIANITQNAVPPQYLFEFRMNESLLYPMTLSKAHNESKNQTRQLIPSNKIVHGFINEKTGQLFGPYRAEVIVWQTRI